MKIPALLVVAGSIFLTSCQTNPPGQVSPSGAAVRTAEAYRLEQKSRAALRDLYTESDAARRLGQTAEAVLVFPEILKGGFIVGGQGGNGTLFFRDGSIGGHYQSVAASYGLQAGIQKFGYALFMMDPHAIRQLNKSGGWEIGTLPNLVIVDEGVAGSISTTTATRGVYAFFFNQRGLMAGLSLQGSKITRIYP